MKEEIKKRGEEAQKGKLKVNDRESERERMIQGQREVFPWRGGGKKEEEEVG